MVPSLPIRLLVVDDAPLKRDGVIAALEADPQIEVVGHAGNQEDAFDMAARLQPAVIIVDPVVMSSRERSTLRHFVGAVPEIPVIAVSADGRAEDVVDAVAAGVCAYLGRRTSAGELRETVRKVHAGAAVFDPALTAELMQHYARAVRGEDRTRGTSLDPRERDVLRLMSQGHTQDEIAEELGISARTVQVTTARIRQKTGLRRRSDLLRWAAEHIPV
jgi:DNA-binding NarL/FixJ family response regulator